MNNPLKIYCEHGALNREIRELVRTAGIEIVHFPYDPNSRYRHISRIASPSAGRIRDLNLAIKDLPGMIGDYSGSRYLKEILSIVGAGNLRDALHVDSAFKSKCSVFVTQDHHILDHVTQLEALLGMKIVHPAAAVACLKALSGTSINEVGGKEASDEEAFHRFAGVVRCDPSPRAKPSGDTVNTRNCGAPGTSGESAR
jgi:hypothetical protein